MSKGYLYDNGYELISREEIDGLPDTSEASQGDVLSLDEDKSPVWSAPSGGGGMELTYALPVQIGGDGRVYFFNPDGTPKSLATIIAEADGTPVFCLIGTADVMWASFDDVTFQLFKYMKSPILFSILTMDNQCYFMYDSINVSLSDAEDKTVNYVELPK